MSEEGVSHLRTGASRRDFLKVTGTIGLSGLAGCTAERPGAGIGIVTYGGLEPLSGPYSALGKNQRRGADLAVTHVNEEYDFEMEIIHEDTQLDPATGRRKAQKLVQQDGARYLVGGTSSAVALALNQFALDNEVVYNPIGAAAAITGKNCNAYVFRANANVAQAVTPLAVYAMNTLGTKVWFHIADYAYGESIYTQMKAEMTKASGGFQEVGVTKSQLGTTNFNSFITQIGNSEAEVVVLGMTGGDLITFVKQASSHGLKDEVDIVSTTITQLLLRGALGKDAYGTYGTIRYSPELDTEANRKFVEDFKAEYGSPPDTFAASSYQAIKMVAAGIDETGSSDPMEVKDTLPGLKVDTIVGRTYFRECDHQAVNDLWVGKNVAPASGTMAELTFLNKMAGEKAIRPCEETDCEM